MTGKAQRREKALANHIRRIKKRLQQLETARLRFSKYRPVVFIIGLALIYWLGWSPLIVAFLLLSIESLYHRQIGNIIKKHQLWLNIKKTQMSRLKLDWKNIPETQLETDGSDHPFETDLNITGKRSLHQLIDMAISREGSLRLKNWLLEPIPDFQKIEKRQTIIREMVPLARFRDKLLLNIKLISKEQMDGKKLLDWLQAPLSFNKLPYVLLSSFCLSTINIFLLLCYSFGLIPGFWVIPFAFYLGLYFMNSPYFNKYFDMIILLDEELRKFKVILRYLESYPFGKNIHLKQLCQPFLKQKSLPSVQLRKIAFVATACGLRMNPMMTILLNIAFPWDLFCVFLINRAGIQQTKQFPEWINVWAELEALVSLANFSYLNPDYQFPEILPDIFSQENVKHQIIKAEKMGHPLIPAAQKVCNDYSVQHIGEIALITGSNMAGKSTFLKTVGINLCLAYCGGPVNASSFRTILFRIFCSMQIPDSIIDGISYFYAEIKRLKELKKSLENKEQIPLFFCIDEIYRGTNSRERLIGSRAFIRHLSKQNGVGLIATHDLELEQMSAQIKNLSNYHFRDDVENGKMVFEYKLYSGPCPTTNALKIMQVEGLPVE